MSCPAAFIMRKPALIILFFGLLSVVVLTAAFKNNTPLPEERIKSSFLQDLDSFYISVAALQDFTAADKNDTAFTSARRLFLDCRQQYKRIEFLVEYIDAEQAENFNGGNVTGGEENILSTKEIPPRGLQVIESLLYSDATSLQSTDISDLCLELMADTKRFRSQAQITSFNTTMILDACRKEIMRICFMGITGFDSPLAKNSIPEAASALKKLQKSAEVYEGVNSDTKSMYTSLNKNFSDAIGYLEQHTDFNSFDRLFFTRTYGNALYAGLLQLHQASGAPYPEELSEENLPVNYAADDLFAADLLNPDYYSPDKKERTNKLQADLGRTLFFDPLLSINNKRACASCHQPDKAFTDGLTKSTALSINGQVKRNAPTLINAIFQGDYFYDVRAKFPETQIDHVIFNADEFNSDYESIINKLNASPEYVTAFKHAFPDQPGTAISTFTITKAIADYVRSLVALNSPFDQYMRRQADTLNAHVRNGYNLFMGKAQCGTCHFAPTFYGTVPPDFTESETEVIGVPATSDTLYTQLDKDEGRFITQRVPAYMNAFKTQTVRNIALTAPYMHNGVFTTLQQVLEFYNRGGAAGLHIDLPQQTLSADKLLLTQQEMQDIIAFMQALTDTSGITSRPLTLPQMRDMAGLNDRKPGGEY